MALKMYGVCVVCSAPGLHGRVYSAPSYMWPRNIGHCTQINNQSDYLFITSLLTTHGTTPAAASVMKCSFQFSNNDTTILLIFASIAVSGGVNFVSNVIAPPPLVSSAIVVGYLISWYSPSSPLLPQYSYSPTTKHWRNYHCGSVVWMMMLYVHWPRVLYTVS